MHLEIEKSQWVAPMPDICQQWQEKGRVELDWYFEQVQKFGADRVLFNSLKMNSELFEKLNKKTKEKNLAPVHVVTTEQFCELDNLKELLSSGVQFAILIYSPLSTELICRVEENKEYLAQLQFVILARKDWNVRNCYRSIPHFMRERLFVDFPISLHSSDPFFKASEVGNAKEKLQEDFLEASVSSFCPHLALFNEWSQKNISHISQPRKLTRTKPQISLVALDADELKFLEGLKVIAENPEKFEILITRVAGQKTKVIPKFKSVTTTKYWAHPIDVNKPVPEIALANFTATQADGNVILFLTGTDSRQLDVLLPLILESQGDFAKLLARKDVFVFEKQRFISKGGFDEILRSWESQKMDSLVRFYGRDSILPLMSEDWGEDIKGHGELTDQLILAHRYSQQIKNFDFIDDGSFKTKELAEKKGDFERRRYLAAQARDKYLNLYSATPKVAIDGHIAYIKNPIVKSWRRHGWKMSPAAHSWFWKLVHLPVKIYHLCAGFFWFLRFYLNPLSYRLTWKLIYSPMKLYFHVAQFYWSYLYSPANKLYWKMVYAPMKIYDVGVRSYWMLFQLAYPFRKVYYFTHFQYEKRILGLHNRSPGSRN